MDRLQKMLMCLGDVNALKGLILWPKFSFTAYAMVSHLRAQGVTPGTVIDVGANVGQFTVASVKLWPGAKVYAFEALPKCFFRLKKHTARLPNVQIHPFAVGEMEKEVEFHVNSKSHSSSILKITKNHLQAFPYAREEKTISVPMRTLDNVLANEAFTGPVLLKLDIQGYETKALEGAENTLTRVDYILLETSFKPMYHGEVCFLDLLKILEGYKFKLLHPVDTLADPRTGEILQADVLFEPMS